MSSGSILRYFPVPQLLNPNMIGVSFSDLAIKAVLIPRNQKRYPIKSSFIPLQKGVVVGGVIVDHEAFVKELQKISQNFFEKRVGFTIPDELIYVYKTEVPFSGSGDLKEAVSFTLEENVPLSIEEAVLDYIPLVDSFDKSGSKVEVVVTACAKKDIQSITNCFESANLEPVIAIPESQALVLSIIPKEEKGNVVIVHARENRIGIYMVDNKVIRFATIRNASDDNYVLNFVDEFKKFKEYWASYEGGEFNISAAYVCGDFKYAKEILSALKERSELVSKLILPNIWINLFNISDYTPPVSFEDSLSLAGATGASISNLW